MKMGPALINKFRLVPESGFRWFVWIVAAGQPQHIDVGKFRRGIERRRSVVVGGGIALERGEDLAADGGGIALRKIIARSERR